MENDYLDWTEPDHEIHRKPARKPRHDNELGDRLLALQLAGMIADLYITENEEPK